MCNLKGFFIRAVVSLLTAFCLLIVSATGAVGAEENVQKISVSEAKKLYDSGATFVDTRSGIEKYFGVIKNSVAMNKKDVIEKANALIPDKDSVVVTYCVSGHRANTVSENLVKLGYKNVYVIHKEGYSKWKKEGYPTAKK